MLAPMATRTQELYVLTTIIQRVSISMMALYNSLRRTVAAVTHGRSLWVQFARTTTPSVRLSMVTFPCPAIFASWKFIAIRSIQAAKLATTRLAHRIGLCAEIETDATKSIYKRSMGYRRVHHSANLADTKPQLVLSANKRQLVGGQIHVWIIT